MKIYHLFYACMEITLFQNKDFHQWQIHQILISIKNLPMP